MCVLCQPVVGRHHIDGYVRSSVQDLELISRALFGRPSTDGLVAPVPFREVSLPKKLKFGYYTSGECEWHSRFVFN